MLEASSFSPPELPASTRLGIFRSLSLPCRDLNRAADFWLKLGFLIDPLDDPWEGFSLPGTPIACHARRILAEPALLFDKTGDVDGDGFTELESEEPLDALGDRNHAILRAPENTVVLMLA